MTFTAAYVRIEIGAISLCAIRADLHLLFKERKTPLEVRLEDQVAARVC